MIGGTIKFKNEVNNRRLLLIVNKRKKNFATGIFSLNNGHRRLEKPCTNQSNALLN